MRIFLLLFKRANQSKSSAKWIRSVSFGSILHTLIEWKFCAIVPNLPENTDWKCVLLFFLSLSLSLAYNLNGQEIVMFLFSAIICKIWKKIDGFWCPQITRQTYYVQRPYILNDRLLFFDTTKKLMCYRKSYSIFSEQTFDQNVKKNTQRQSIRLSVHFLNEKKV